MKHGKKPHYEGDSHTKLKVPHTDTTMGRAIAMPNLKHPITTTEPAKAYHQRILAQPPQGSAFEALVTLYLTDKTTSEKIHRVADCGVVHGVYDKPVGASPHCESGVSEIRTRYPICETQNSASFEITGLR